MFDAVVGAVSVLIPRLASVVFIQTHVHKEGKVLHTLRRQGTKSVEALKVLSSWTTTGVGV